MAWWRDRATAGLALCVTAVALAAGCAERRTAQVPAAQQQAAAQQQQRQQRGTMAIVRRDRPSMQRQRAAAAPGEAMVTQTVQLPAGEDGQPVVLEYRAPREVSLGQSFDYEMVVSNRGNEPVQEVTVSQQLPSHFRMISSDPSPERTEAGATMWELGRLDPGESQTVRITGRATEARPLRSTGSTSYLPQVSVATNVVQPSLGLTASAPEEALICETIPVNLTITNNGSGAARDVRLRQELPDGLVTSEGDSRLEVEIGNLAAGATQQYTLNLEANRTGQFTIPLETSSGDLQAGTQVQTTVREPELSLSMDAQPQVRANQRATYTISVRNTGDAPAENATIRTRFPAEAEFINASDGGRQTDGEVVWDLDTIPADGSRQVTLTLRPTAGGVLSPRTTATARCARTTRASSETEVMGVPAVRLEVSDSEDPVEVGNEVTYRITVTNQGSDEATNTMVEAKMTPNMEVISVGGATDHQIQGQIIDFGPVQSLAPGEQATWQVTAKSADTGETRLQVRMANDEIEDPIQESETTRMFE